VPAAATPVVPTLLDSLLAGYDEQTMQGRAVAAPLEAVASAIRDTPLDQARLARLLIEVRTLGRVGRRRAAPLVEVGDGERGVITLGTTATEVVFGFVGRPWPGGDPVVGVTDTETWRAYEPADAVKVAVSVRCAAASYGTLLVTETRIQIGPLARRPFGRYWLLVRPGSDLVRASMLRAIGRRATA
jgi:hypothetical protein